MATSVAAIASLRAEREIVEHLRQSGATTPASAAPLPALRPLGQRRLRRLVNARVVMPADGRYYVDEAMYSSYRADRRGAVLAAAAAALALAVGMWLGTRA